MQTDVRAHPMRRTITHCALTRSQSPCDKAHPHSIPLRATPPYFRPRGGLESRSPPHARTVHIGHCSCAATAVCARAPRAHEYRPFPLFSPPLARAYTHTHTHTHTVTHTPRHTSVRPYVQVDRVPTKLSLQLLLPRHLVEQRGNNTNSLKRGHKMTCGSGQYRLRGPRNENPSNGLP